MANDRVSDRRAGDGSTTGAWRRLARVFRRSSRFDPLNADDEATRTAERTWRPCIKRRTLVLLAVLACWTAVIEARLVVLQVVEHDELVRTANDQQEETVTLRAMRGDIVDRHGQLLAYSVPADAIVASPKSIKPEEKASTAKALCDALGDCTAKDRGDLLQTLSSRKAFKVIRSSRSVSPEQVARVMALKLPAIALQRDTRRYYPQFDLASHLVGFVDADNVGKAGVEYSHDAQVRGEDGYAIARIDGRQQRLETRVEKPPVAGASLELTIDITLQHILERELKAGVIANKAAGGTAVLMDPYTGEVLAMASYPTFNPNAAGAATDAERLNRAVGTVYEPGSTFKVVTASAALDEGIVSATDLIDTNPGVITFPGRKPITESQGHNYGVLSFEDVIVKSSNIGAIKVGQRVGAERLTRYVTRFGFGQRIMPDLWGESRGIWSPSTLDPSGLASVSMGYQISVTPVQMAAAVSSVANGGVLIEPHIVRAVLKDGVREPVAPTVLRRTISASTAATLTSIMEGVVQRGTATAAQLAGYQIAGKTGTAHKATEHGYSTTDFNASFVGFVPSRRPVFTLLVVIDTPRAGTHFGGTVAAPIFKKIAEAALQLDGVPSSIDPIPPVIIKSPPALPFQRTRSSAPAMVPAGGPMLTPDVRGLAAREAMRVLTNVGLTIDVAGAGIVVLQSPDPGSPVQPGARGRIELRRQPVDPHEPVGGAW